MNVRMTEVRNLVREWIEVLDESFRMSTDTLYKRCMVMVLVRSVLFSVLSIHRKST